MQPSKQTLFGVSMLTSLTVFDVMCSLNKFATLSVANLFREHMTLKTMEDVSSYTKTKKLQLCRPRHTKFAKFTLCRHSFQNISWYDQSFVISTLQSCVVIH